MYPFKQFTPLRRRSGAALAAALTTVLLIPAASEAATVRLIEEDFCGNEDCSYFYHRYRFALTDAIGQKNDVVVSLPKPRSIIVRDATSTLDAGDFCSNAGDHEVVCHAPENPEPHQDKVWMLGAAVLGPLDDTASLEGAPVGLWGGEGDDSLAGDAGENQLRGEGGADTLRGGPGDDMLDGGAGADVHDGGDGRDLMVYAARTAGQPIAVTLDGLRNDGADPNRSGISSTAEEADQDRAIERVVAGAGPDRLAGGPEPDHLVGGAGDDRLDGGPNADVLDGGDGSDTLSYVSRGEDQHVNVRLDGVANDGADPNRDGTSVPAEEADLDLRIEHAVGGAGHDRLAGNPAVNRLYGGFGADRLDGGLGADLLDGGSGSDTMTYATRGLTDPVAIRLDGLRNDGSDPNHSGVSGGASEEGDRDISIENGIGGAGADYLRSQLTGANILTGNGGDDRIFARDGSAAVDTVGCGGGTDRYQVDPSDTAIACETAIP